MLPWIRDNMPEQYFNHPQLGVYYIAYDMRSEPLNALQLRKAISLAVDRDLLVTQVLRGDQTPAYSIVPPGLPGYTQAVPSEYESSIEERRKLAGKIIKMSGYTDEQPLNITLYYNMGENHRRIALFVADQLSSALPIVVTTNNVEFRVLLSLLKDPNAWDMVRSSWIADYADPYNFLSIFRSNAANNIPGFENAEFDELLNQSLMASSHQERLALLSNAEMILADSFPALFLYYYVDRRMVSPLLEPIHGNAMAIVKSQHLKWLDTAHD